jgi:putative endonuclease
MRFTGFRVVRPGVHRRCREVVGVGPEQTGRSDKDRLGRYGEDLAAQHLAAAGMVLLDRNWRCREGELDAVARDVDGTLVFVEVKTRSGNGFGEPAEAVGQAKARRIRLLACRWLAAYGPTGGADLRFDVIAVVRRRGDPPKVTHLKGAF